MFIASKKQSLEDTMKKIGITMLMLLLLSSGCAPQYETISTDRIIDQTAETIEEGDHSINTEVQKEELSLVPEVKEIKIGAVGDLMVHKWQLNRAYDQETQKFDFSNSFQYVKPYLEEADLLIGNLETTLAGKDQGRYVQDSYVRGYQGYPYFNSPDSFAQELKNVGFDVLCTANNHCLDSGKEGLFRTIDVLDGLGIQHLGTYQSKEKKEAVFFTEANGFTIAMANYTYGTNGLNSPEGEEYIVNSLDVYDEQKITEMLAQIKKAEEKSPDLVIVMIHFGNEYHYNPNEYQKRIVDQLFQAGADIVLGSHPHVLEPILIRKKQGNVKIAIFSMGNFISSQRYTNAEPVDKDAGVIFNIIAEKKDNKVLLHKIEWIPTYVHWGKEDIKVLPIIKNMDEENEAYNELTGWEKKRVEQVQNNSTTILTKNLKGHIEKEEDRYSYIILPEEGNHDESKDVSNTTSE